VPFGEYLPFQGALEAIGLSQLTRIRGGFSAGPRRATVTLRDAPPFAPLICYEAIFPDEVVDPGNRPGWLLNVTNDAWFGTTIGPYQHLDQARIRAVEQGLPLVRAANSGISAVIDGYGRIRRSLALETAGAIEQDLPRALAPTPYAGYGDGLFAGLLAAAALAAAAGRAKARRV
jgi:apolipoprotein N-acyltransferase